MSFLKKIFAKNQIPPDAPAPAEKQRSPRIQLNVLHRVHFTPQKQNETPNSSQEIDLVNLSTTGMALICREAQVARNIGDTLSGTLFIDQKQFALENKIRHLSRNLIGCEFVQPKTDLHEAIRNYLRVEISALRLRKINDAYVKSDVRGQPLWYSDGQNSELYAVRTADNVVHFHMSFLGYYVEGGQGKVVRGGLVKADTEDHDPAHKKSDLLELESHLNPEVATLATRFLQGIDNMSDDLRREITQHLQP
jgi:PilZ domain